MIKTHTLLDTFIVSPVEKLENVLERIKKHQILFICNDNKVLLGCISIGDVRRHITKTHLTVIEIGNTTPFVFGWETEIHSLDRGILNLFKKNGLFLIPRVDDTNRLIEIIEIPQAERRVLDEYLIIMAGGKGTRMLPLTKEIPKPMAPVKGKPMIQHIIDKAKAEGFRKFIISLGYLGEVIEHHFTKNIDNQIEIIFIKEEKPLGTAGALSLLQDMQISKSFVVTNGDLISDVSYRELLEYHKDQGAQGTMVVKEHLIKNPYGVIITEGEKIKKIVEKPITKSLVNAGVYCFNSEIIKTLKKNHHLDMTSLFEMLIAQNKKCNIYGLLEEWNDIANIEQLKTINEK